MHQFAMDRDVSRPGRLIGHGDRITDPETESESVGNDDLHGAPCSKTRNPNVSGKPKAKNPKRKTSTALKRAPLTSHTLCNAKLMGMIHYNFGVELGIARGKPQKRRTLNASR